MVDAPDQASPTSKSAGDQARPWNSHDTGTSWSETNPLQWQSHQSYPCGERFPSGPRLTTGNQGTTIRPRFQTNQATSPSRMEHIYTGSGKPK